jgi:acyl carrier protein
MVFHMNTTLTEKDTAEIQNILIQQLDISREQLAEEATIVGDLGADSLDVVEISMNLEERFNLTIPDDQWERVKTVGDLYAAMSEFLDGGHQVS